MTQEKDLLKRIEALEGGQLPEEFQSTVMDMLGKLDQRLTLLESKGTDDLDREACELNDYGVQLFYLNEWEQAYDSFQRALERAPDSAEILNNLAVVQSLRIQPEEATEWFSKAVALKPDLVAILNNKGVLALLQSDPVQAVKTLEQAHVRDPQNQTVLFNLAKAFESSDQKKKAIQMFRQVLNLNPEHREANYHLRKHYQ